jgi:hypothetical protein
MDDTTFNTASGKTHINVSAYIDQKKRKIGYAYITQSGNHCIKGSEIMDKAKLGQLIINGLYIELDSRCLVPRAS